MKYYTLVCLITAMIGLVYTLPVRGDEQPETTPPRPRPSRPDRMSGGNRPFPSNNFYHFPRPVKTDQNRQFKDEPRIKRQQQPRETKPVSLNISAKDLGMSPLRFKGKAGEINYCQAVENKAETEKCSLVVVLHGKSGCGNDNQRQLTSPAVKPLLNYIRAHSEKAVVLVPQCPANQDWVRGGSVSPLLIILELVKSKCEEFNISSDQIYVTGVSMGGGACYSIMTRQPGLFSKAIIVSSGGRTEGASRLNGDFYIVHGENDRLIPLAKAQAMVNAIQMNSNAHVTFSILSGKDHIQASQNAYSDECFRWLFQK